MRKEAIREEILRQKRQCCVRGLDIRRDAHYDGDEHYPSWRPSGSDGCIVAGIGANHVTELRVPMTSGLPFTRNRAG